MNNRFIWFWLVVFFLPGLICGQPGKGKLKYAEYSERANQLLRQSNYEEAARYLEKVIVHESQNTALLYQLADAYRLAKNSALAVKYYGRLLKLAGTGTDLNYPLILFHYGDVLMRNGNYHEAKEVLHQFQKNYHGENPDYYKNWAGTMVSGCELHSGTPETEPELTVSFLDKNINSGKTEYAPVFIQEDLLLFSSLRPDQADAAIDGGMRSSIYTSQLSEERWQKPVPFPGPFRYLNDHVGHGSFSPDKERFYFTICPSETNNDPCCSIYYTQIEGTSWGDPQSIPKINIDGYKSTTPFATIDDLGTERIYFSSNRPEGEGAMDIWYVIRDAAGNFTTPKNVGPKVNTPYNEITPFYFAEANRFYFSSDGYPGMGGFDIFQIPFDGNHFGVIKNPGKPINSSQDDMYYVENKDGTSGFLVSNREVFTSGVSTTCCDNIFEFKQNHDQKSEQGVIFRGRVFGIDGQQTFEIEDVLVQWYEQTKKGDKMWVDEVYVFNNQPFEFTTQKGRSYEIQLAKEGFETETYLLEQEKLSMADSMILKDFFLKSEGTIIRGVVYGDDGKRTVLLPGVEMKVYRINSVTRELKHLKTLGFDEEGFRTALQTGVDYKIIFTRPDYLVGSLFVSSGDLQEEGIPEFHVALLRELEGISTIIRDVNFESESIDLRAASLIKLDQIAEFLNDNPSVAVEIGAFTDDMGATSISKNLSENRANAVIAYLMGKGVNPERLVAKGYGATNPIAPNDTEENRQLNRRIEMKILKINK